MKWGKGPLYRVSGDHFVVFTKMELCCIPETNVMSYASFFIHQFQKVSKNVYS